MSDPKSDAKLNSKLVGARFLQSVEFGGESMAVTVRADGTGTADAILPARIAPDGRPTPCEGNEQPTGVVVRKRVHDRNANVYFVAQNFVPWANIRCLVYGA